MRWISLYELFVRQGNVSEGAVHESKQRLLGRLWVHGPSSHAGGLLYRSDIFWHPWNCHGFWSWCWYPLIAAYVTQGINALPSFIQEFPRVAGWPANVWFSPSPNAFRHVFNHILMISHGFQRCPKLNVTNASMTPLQCHRYVLGDVANCNLDLHWWLNTGHFLFLRLTILHKQLHANSIVQTVLKTTSEIDAMLQASFSGDNFIISIEMQDVWHSTSHRKKTCFFFLGKPPMQKHFQEPLCALVVCGEASPGLSATWAAWALLKERLNS